MNLKEITTKQKLADAKQQRVEDFMRSGGSGNLRTSLFGRKDEVVTTEMEKEFKETIIDALLDEEIWGVNGQEYKNKQVMEFYVKFPDAVTVGKVDALLAKVDYNKETHVFTALYRPKDGKWGQAVATGKKLGNKLGQH
jgi:hypothetical protein